MRFAETVIIASIVFCYVFAKFLPAHWWYLSPRKRSAVLAATHWLSQDRNVIVRSARIYRDLDNCLIVMVVPASNLLDPVRYFCRVDADGVSLLGASQCRFGQKPDDLWDAKDV